MEHLGVAPTRPVTPPEDLCRQQVERIIQSPEFNATDREGRFLRYVVEETLAGNALRIKAYAIAIAVFGRKESFDPQTDPIVRIEAGRLRRALERYYLTAGVSDPLVITIPKGHYVPTFAVRDLITAAQVPEPEPEPESVAVGKPPVGANPNLAKRYVALAVAAAVGLVAVGLVVLQPGQMPQPAAMPELPRVLVEQFEVQDPTETSGGIATAVREEVIARLSRFRDIAVLAPGDASAADLTPPPRYSLKGSITMTSVGFRLRTSLVQRLDGAVLWSNSYDADLKVTPLVQVQADMANHVARQLGQSYGVIVLAEKEFKRGLSPEDWAAYSCVQSFNSFRATLDPAMIPDVQTCLEQTVARFPDYSTAWALLSIHRINGLRGQFPYDPVASKATVDRAFSDARQAMSLDPQNVRALQAEMLALFWNKQFAQGQAVGDRALALNPNDTDLLAEYGNRLALSGAWQKGCPMIRNAFVQDQIPILYYSPVLALCSYFEGDLADAVAQISKTTNKSHPLHLMVAAAIYGEAGNHGEADRFRRLLLADSPALAQNLAQEVTLRLGRPEDAAQLLNSLAKAGL